MKKIKKRNYQLAFMAIVLLLAVVRLCCPSIAGKLLADDLSLQHRQDSINRHHLIDKRPQHRNLWKTEKQAARFPRIYSTEKLKVVFADSNPAQKRQAELHGIRPAKDRQACANLLGELVYVGSTPYYHVDSLSVSVPYLVPSAAVLLQDIGRRFIDSLYTHHMPPCRIIVTSITRTRDDVSRLLRRNKNATPRSCHLYGTTFDISYTRFDGDKRRIDYYKGKQVLADVLEELRQQGRCLIKYEYHQPVFHVTVAG